MLLWLYGPRKGQPYAFFSADHNKISLTLRNMMTNKAS